MHNFRFTIQSYAHNFNTQGYITFSPSPPKFPRCVSPNTNTHPGASNCQRIITKNKEEIY